MSAAEPRLLPVEIELLPVPVETANVLMHLPNGSERFARLDRAVLAEVARLIEEPAA
jgi:hypothetical protein